MDEEKSSVVKIKVIPRSSKNCLRGVLDDGTFRISLTAPPVDGKANKALIKFLSSKLGISEDFVEIVSGQTSHTKFVKIIGLDKTDIQKIITL
jgi:uncharacterized protein (TIGR00251 family)